MHLLPEAGRNSMVAATEMLLIDDAAREVVRSGDLGHLSLLMRMDGATATGHSLDRSLLDLLAAGRVRFVDVFARAEEKSLVLERSRQMAASVAAVRPETSS
jgi:Tfp pilus assembly ATPase PilU